jgi:hypothetical protein
MASEWMAGTKDWLASANGIQTDGRDKEWLALANGVRMDGRDEGLISFG